MKDSGIVCGRGLKAYCERGVLIPSVKQKEARAADGVSHIKKCCFHFFYVLAACDGEAVLAFV